MSTVIAKTWANMTRHFIVWGLLAVVVMYSGIMENHSRSGHWERPPATGTFERVMLDNVCKDTVEGQFPTAVVLYNLHTGGYEFSTKPAHIGKALDEEFAGKDWPGYTAKHFCK
jgi:hypothetical protein